MLYLRLPITIQTSGEELSAEISLPSRSRGLAICICRTDKPWKRRQMCETLGDIGMATILLQPPAKLSSRHIVDAVDWARSQRFLRKLPISIIATGEDAAAAQKAAHRRPVAVRSVLSTAAREVKPEATAAPELAFAM